MTNNYGKLVNDNLQQLFSGQTCNLAADLPAAEQDGRLVFDAFGRQCAVGPGGITLNGQDQANLNGLLVSHYCLSACPDLCEMEPLKALKEFGDDVRYLGASTTHAERLLKPHADKIKQARPEIMAAFCGRDATGDTGGDFAIIVHPLPKIALCYIFYEADEEFSASVTCLYSNNAGKFMPIDGLADLGEYTSKAILELLGLN